MQPKKDALGKGIKSLLQNIEADLRRTDSSLTADASPSTGGVAMIELDKIEVNPNQPRTHFDEEALNELSKSIKTHGIIQPLVVYAIGNGKYRLIAGERRLRASRLAGLKEVPVYIRKLNDSDILELALIENLDRENLNPIEIAISYKRMEEELNYSHEQIADRVKKERASITNYIRLLKLPPNIIDAIKQGKISFGHGRAIINLVDQEVQMYVFKQIIEQELSVRKTEALVKRMNTQKKPSGNPVKTSENPYRKIEDLISSEYGTKARIINKNGKGNITLEFFSIDELNGLLEKLNIKVS